MTRREWLAAALPGALLSARERADLSRISVITDETARTPAEAIAFARQYGLSWVELRSVPGLRKSYTDLSEAELREAARQLAGSGLKVSFLNSGMFKITLPETEPVFRRPESEQARASRIARHAERFQKRHEDLRNAVRAAQILGTDLIRCFGFLRVAEPSAALPRVAEIVGEMAALAEKEGIRLLVENETSCNVATSYELADLMRLLPSRSAGINWDPYNGRHFGEVPFPDGYKALPKERIGNVQIKGRSLLYPEERLDWKTIFQTMIDDGYKGRFGLETHIFGEKQIHYSHESMKEILRLLEAS